MSDRLDERQIDGVAGLRGRGSCYSDVGGQYVVGQALEIETSVRIRWLTVGKLDGRTSSHRTVGRLTDSISVVARPIPCIACE